VLPAAVLAVTERRAKLEKMAAKAQERVGVDADGATPPEPDRPLRRGRAPARLR